VRAPRYAARGHGRDGPHRAMSDADDVPRHYQELLADHYDWMFARPIDAIVAEQKAALQQCGIEPARGGRALDLGCGSGFQSLALSQLGYQVLAVDTSEKLLGQLAARARAERITPQLADIRDLDQLVAPATFSVVVCMGDTLTHLPR